MLSPLARGSIAAKGIDHVNVGELQVEGGKLVFNATRPGSAPGEGGVFALVNCRLITIVYNGDIIDGLRVKNVFDISPQSLSDGSLVISVQLEDGSYAIYRTDLPLQER